MNLQEALLFVARFEKGEYAPEEQAAFVEWLEGASIEDLTVIADEHEAREANWQIAATAPSAEWIDRLESKLDHAESREGQAIILPMGRERLTRNRFWAVAASIIVLFSGGAYWWFARQSAAGTDKQLNEVLSNIASAPRGQQKELVLPDGSKVWLNAASTLKYPRSFTGGDRIVELSGEAYFEVARNAATPFKVKVRDAQVEVLGTHFNVSGYPDDPGSTTTLLEGMIKIARGAENHILQPGDQVEIDYPESGAPSQMKLVQGVDPDAVIAWKKGVLEFNDDDIYTVMRTVARAYDVDIQYEGQLTSKGFHGSFKWAAGLDQILEQLKAQKIIHYKIINNRKTIVVTP
jgi:ferric-dicitrate binding protein FerR (iron transport regulator)